MFGKQKDSSESTIRIHTLISQEATFEGNITMTGNIKVDGKMVGNTVTDGGYVTGDAAVVNGNVQAGSVIFAGTLTGNIHASGAVTLKASAGVKGDIKAASLIVEPGARFSGHCSIGDSKQDE